MERAQLVLPRTGPLVAGVILYLSAGFSFTAACAAAGAPLAPALAKAALRLSLICTNCMPASGFALWLLPP